MVSTARGARCAPDVRCVCGEYNDVRVSLFYLEVIKIKLCSMIHGSNRLYNTFI